MKITWGSSKTVGGREVLEGNTVINGKSYTVKVSYNSSALKNKYGEGTDLNKKIDAIFKKIEDSDLERLEGYKFRTSLQKIKGERSFSIVKGSSEVNLDDLKKNKREFYNSIKSVNKAFSDFGPKKLEEKKGVDDGIEIEVAESKKPDLKSLTDQLSNNNPAQKDEKLLEKIFQYNKAKKEKLKKEILAEIQKIESDEFKHEVVRLMKEKEVQQEFRIALGFIKDGDIVCEFAQSSVSKIDARRKDEQGQFACGPICLKAVQRLILGKKIKSEQDIQEVIKEGVTCHVTKMKESVEKFDTLLSKFNEKVPKNKKLKKNIKLDAKAVGEIGEILPHFAEDDFKGHYCLLTFPVGKKQFGKTVFAYYSGNKFNLFDSHSTTQNNVTGFGATLRGFDTAKDLAKHIQDNYIKMAKNFEYHFISQA